MNMGTQSHPEGLPHWTVKSMMAHKLRSALRAPARKYGALHIGELRNVTVPTQLQNPGLTKALERVADRVDPWPGFSYIGYKENPHGGCEGGTALVNILDGMEGGRVEMETPFGGYIPDIAVYPKDAEQPSCIIECVDTSPPSPAKVKALDRLGIPVYVLRAHKGAWDVLHQPCVEVEAVGCTVLCGKKLRKEVGELMREWGESPRSFIGICNYPSNSQSYLWGQHDAYATLEYHYGDPEVVGWARNDPAAWPRIPMVAPIDNCTRHISRKLFMDYLMWQRQISLQLEAATRDATDQEARKLRGFLVRNVRYIDDLLRMVHCPK